MEAKEVVFAVVEKVTNKKVTSDTVLFDVIQDSLAFAEIAGELELTYPGITDDMFDANTIQDVVNFCHSREFESEAN